ncbi:DMT family transporter [Sphingopyxis sp.]|uniref:EamA family transporter n=1 Tax=Sphingopyxis sp. TaxID=1908224 RepID=UPI0035B1681E
MTDIAAPSPSALPQTLLHRLLPYLAMAGSILSFCVGTSFAKQLYPLVGAEGAVAYRVGFAAIILLLAFRPWRHALTRSDFWVIARYGVALGFMNFCFYMAIRTIPLGLALAIEFLGPLTVSVLYARTRTHFIAVGLAAGGLLLLLPVGDISGTLDPAGVLFALCAAVCWGLYILFGKRTARLHGGQAVSLGMATAALFVVPIGIHGAGPAFFVPSVMLLGLIPAILSSAIPYSLEMIALKRIPENSFGILLSGEPAVGAVAGAIILGEWLSPVQCGAIAMIAGASALAATASSRAA